MSSVVSQIYFVSYENKTEEKQNKNKNRRK